MVNQQMLDYIKQQMQQGASQEQIKNSLMANGWQQQDVEEGFNNIVAQSTPSSFSAIPVAASSGTWKIIAGIVIGVAILGGSAYLASQTVFKSKETPKISNEVSNQPSVETSTNTTTPQPSQQPATQTKPQSPEIVFADKLSSCTPYKISFKHPFTGDMLEKEILGIVNGKCDYVEQMPNNGKMECKYTENERKAAGQYYKDVASAESVGTSVNANLGSGETKTTYTIDGKVVDNPLHEFMNSGVCVITGY